MANQKSQSLEQLLSADYWRQLCPQLHVEDKNYQDGLTVIWIKFGHTKNRETQDSVFITN